MVRVEQTGHGPFVFLLFGSISHGDGLECRDINGDGRREVVLLSVRTQYGEHQWERWDWKETWNGKTLSVMGTRQGTYVASTPGPLEDPRFGRFWEFRCGTLTMHA